MKRTALIAAVVTIALGAASGAAWASKGNQHTGYGPIQEAMAGTGVAAALDAHTIMLNPAGMTAVPNRFDFAMGFGLPITHMDTSAAPIGNAAAGNQKGEMEVLPLPFISATLGFLDNRIVAGLSFIQDGGAMASYKQSRTNPLITGNSFDRFIDYKAFSFAPAIAFKLRDNLSFGTAVQVGYATLSTDLINNATGSETAGGGRTDSAWGIGGSLGMVYTPIPEISLGFSYTSKTIYQKFKKYSDVLHNRSLDAPHQVQAGIAARPFDWWLICADFHWLNWSGVGLLGSSPANGGLGWRDQYVAALGTQFTALKRLHFRLGASWQTSVVRADTVFANALAPLIAEINVNGGLGLDVTDRIGLDLAFAAAIPNHKTQSGGDAVSIMGTGTRSEYTGYVLVVGASYKWDK